MTNDKRQTTIRRAAWTAGLAVMLFAVALIAGGQQGNQLWTEAIHTDSTRVYLHVAVETSYGWFWQRSTGRAYTTTDAAGKQRVKVKELCLALVAHDSTTQCAEQADSVVVTEKKRGIAIPRRTARVSAISRGPNLGPETMEMRP
jgi:hypothetical protein